MLPIKDIKTRIGKVWKYTYLPFQCHVEEERAKMKAVRVHKFGFNHPMQVDEVDDPTPGPGEILIRARAAGVNWVDLLVRSGDNPRSKLLTLPYIPGDNTAGEVAAVGPGTEGFKVGQRVFGMGFNSYATLVVTKAGYIGELPESYGFEEGAGIPSPFFTAWNAVVFTAKASAGETVLVHGGGGGVGGAAVQLAKRMGCRVIATEISKEKTDLCKQLGADETINFHEADFAARCKEMTDGRGVDVIIDVSTTDNFDKDLDAIAIHGRIVVVGFRMGQGPKTDFRVFSLMQKNATVHGIAFAHLYSRLPELIRRFLPLLREGIFRIKIDHSFPIEEANEAHAMLQSGKVSGKVMLRL